MEISEFHSKFKMPSVNFPNRTVTPNAESKLRQATSQLSDLAAAAKIAAKGKRDTAPLGRS